MQVSYIFQGTTSIWPFGTYDLPRPRLGCPASYRFEWKTGWRYQNTDDSLPSNDYSDIFHIDATVWEDDLNKTFCIEEEKAFGGKDGIWRKGERFVFNTLSVKFAVTLLTEFPYDPQC